MRFKLGEKYEYAVSKDSIKRILSVIDAEDTFNFYRKGEAVPKTGFLALQGDRENNNFFVWCDVALNGYLKKI